MVKKRVFPDDWSDLTDAQVIENVKYLEKNYSKYKVDIPKRGVIVIGNVKAERKIKLDTNSKVCLVCTINNKEIYAEKVPGVYSSIVLLEAKCQNQLKSFDKKLASWLKDNKTYLINGGVSVAIIATFIAMLNYFIKNYNMTVTIETHEKTAPIFHRYNPTLDTLIYNQDTVKTR